MDKEKIYLEERKGLIRAILGQSHSFDKAILTLAAGALGLSLAFIENITPAGVRENSRWLLGAGWLGFLFSIILTLTSFLTSQKACSEQIRINEKHFLEEKELDRNWWSAVTLRLNQYSIVAFSVGIVFLGSFSYINLPVYSGECISMSEKENIKEGFVPPTPPKSVKGQVFHGFVPENPPKIESQKSVEKGYVPPPPPPKPTGDSKPKN